MLDIPPVPIREDFIPPIREDEPYIIQCFIRIFPDLSSIFNCPCLNFIPCYKKFRKHIDSIGIITVIVSISLSCLFAIGLFFISIAAIQTTLFVLLCFSSTIAILSTGTYIKKYYLLFAIQKEMNIFEKYSQALNEHISKLQEQFNTMNGWMDCLSKRSNELQKENESYTLLNTELAQSLSEIKKDRENFQLENVKLSDMIDLLKNQNQEIAQIAMNLQEEVANQKAENDKLDQSNRSLESTAKRLHETVIKVEENYQKQTEEFEKFKHANTILATLIQLVDAQEKKLEGLKTVSSDISLQNELTEAMHLKHKEDLDQTRTLLEQKKNELFAVTEELKKASKEITLLLQKKAFK